MCGRRLEKKKKKVCVTVRLMSMNCTDARDRTCRTYTADDCVETCSSAVYRQSPPIVMTSDYRRTVPVGRTSCGITRIVAVRREE